MVKQLKYSFDDEPVCKFSYSLDKKKIKVHFNGYYDLVDDIYIHKTSTWILENWEYAKSRIGDELKRYELNKQMGIFSLILYMKYNEENELEMLVNTIDNRYVTLFFKEPKLSLI